MTRRITCYVVFVTLIWGAHTQSVERFQDMFKSNTTRSDFSNLLSSLIKQNEQRVNFLQKLYHLEDYGVLSEVLRSGDKKTMNGNPSNLFLIVISKNPIYSSHRNSGYQLVDSVTSFEVAGSKDIPKLDYVLDPASFVSQNDRKEYTLTKSIFPNTLRVYKQKKKHLSGDRIIKITTTKKPLQMTAKQKRKHFINLLMTPKDTFQAKESRMIEIVSKNKSSNASLPYSSTVAINDHSNKIELILKKYKLTTIPITIKDILRSKSKKPKYNFEYNIEKKDEHYNGSPFNISFKNNVNNFIKNTTQINGDMFTKLILYDNFKPETDKNILKVQKTKKAVKKIDYNNHPKTGTDKVISKVARISVQKIDDNNHPKSGTDKFVPKVNDISVKKKDDSNHHKPEKNQDTLKTKVQGNQHTKLIRNKSNLLKLGNKTSRIETDRRTTVVKSPDQIINGTVGSDNASESNHMVFNISPIQNPNLNIIKDDAYEDDFMANIRRKNATMETGHGDGVPLITDITSSVAASNILAPLRFPKTAKNTPNRNNLDFLWNPNNSKDHSNDDKMTTPKDLHLNGDNHNDRKPKIIKDYDSEENNNYGKNSKEVFTLVVTDEGKRTEREGEGRKEGAEKNKVLPDLQLALNGFDQPETKPIARETFQKCLNKKARKLCYKSCKSAFQNVCRRMKCTSRSKRALKKECKRSCQKTFKSSKYSDDDSNESRSKSRSDESDDSNES